MNNNREKIYLSALVHDIGKFYQRADKRLLKDYTEVHLERMKSLICPENEFGGFGYQHAWWTYKFLEDNKGVFDNIKENGERVFKVAVNEETDQDNLVNLAIYHHKPHGDSDLQKIIQLADWWSSGMERTSKNNEGENDEKYGWFKYKKVRLKNILSLINEGKNTATFPLSPLNISRKVFDKVEKIRFESRDNAEISEDYNILWQDFEKQLKALPTDSVKGFFESFLLLLQKYTWCMPASTNDLAHISLYEHLKTTAAIALALYDFKEESKCSFEDLKDNKEIFPLLLSCWDVSGIQKFIYNVSGAKAAVSLKGRSFYLQLLVETVKQKILDHPDIEGFTGQVVYSSGGKMFILLPNTEKCKKALNELHHDFEKILWEEHKDQLYLNHGFVEFRCEYREKGKIIYKNKSNKSKEGTIADLWGEVIDRAGENKYRKYKKLLGDEINFKPFGKWGKDYGVCAVTGEVGEINKELFPVENGDTIVLKSVNEQIELGKALKDVDYIITYLDEDVKGNTYLENRLRGDKKSKHLTIRGTHIHHYLFDQEELIKDQAEFRNITSIDVSRVRRINNTDFNLITSLKGNKCTHGFQFYGGNTQALNTRHDRNKTFEELCWTDGSGSSGSSTFLGVLRMDIDNLGKIFKEGLSEELRSFAAYSTMSAQLDWFFSGYLNTLRNSDEFKDYVNIIYSGGDDVFAVGRWDKIILFAEEIRTKFKAYIGGREDVSISGGVVLVGPKFPIRMAAFQAGEAEDQSKDFVNENGKTKNAITLFGETISWEEEFEEVKKIKEKLVHYCGREEKPISKAIFQQLMQWKIQKDSFQNKTGNATLSFRWNTAYYLKRYIDRYKNDEEARSFLKSIQTALMCGQAMYNNEKYGLRIYNLFGLAARWAEMEMKEFENYN